MVLNVFNALRKIICPDCKLVCTKVCLKRLTLLRLQKLIYTVLMTDKNRIKKNLKCINFKKVMDEIEAEPDKHKGLLLTLINAIVDGKVGVDKK